MLAETAKGHQVVELPGGTQRPRRPLLGQLLLASGVVTPDQLREALCRQQESGQLLGELLVEMGALTPAQLEWALQEQKRLEEGS